MPAKDFSQSVFQADANAATDWGSVGAGVAVEFRGSAEMARGLDIDLGLMAIANLDASFSQFLAADLQGSAQAQASVRAQIELPLNLFDEVGAAVRLQAIAELAAGVRLGVGLALGDFLALAGENIRGGDISMRLLRILIEESELQIGVFAKAALSAQAYANLVVTGSAISNPARGTTPGFTIAAGAGAGLKAGAGFQVFGTAKVGSFSRLVARSADAVVDDTVRRLSHALPDAAAPARAVLFGLRPAFKIALRLTFELGEQFARQGLSHDAAGQDALSARGLQVVLEELQRAICDGALRATSVQLDTLLTPVHAAGQAWEDCHAERHALADLLEAAPHPFADAEGTGYWLDVMSRGADLAGAVASSQPRLIDAVSMGWCALKLAARVGERVERASAGVSVIGLPSRQVAAAFQGPLTGNVPARIEGAIRNALAAGGSNVSGALRYEHLASYLTQRTVVDAIVQANPGLAAFLDEVRGALAPDIAQLVGLVLANASSFPVGGAAADPITALTVITRGIQQYVANRLNAALRAQLEPAFAGREDLRVYFDEVLLPTLDFSLLIIAQEALGWAASNRSTKAVTEALSAVLLKLLGRSLVAIADTASSHVQEQMADLMRRAADGAARADGLIDVLTRNPAVNFAADEIAELVHDALMVAADVFGPMSGERRARIRGLLYELLDPAGPAPGAQLLQQLENPGVIPNENALRELAQELGQLATERFVLFVEGLVMRILERVSAAFLEALEAVIAVAEQFLADVSRAIGLIVQRLDEIARDLQALANQIADAVAGALGDLDAMLDGFSSNSGRTRFVDEIASSVSSSALALLEDNWAYRNLVPGGVRSDIRARVRRVVRDLLEASPFEEFLAAIGLIRDQFEEIVEDARNLDRNAPLAPQVADLVIARLASLVADRYGTVRIKVAFTFSWNTPLGRGSHEFDLGRIRVRVGDVADIIRPVSRGLGAFEEAVAALTDRIRAIFDAEEETSRLRDEEEAAAGERTRLQEIENELRSGPKSLVIERPVQMQTTRADTRVVIRLDGFSPAILTADEDTPQRLFILLNGEPVSLDSFRVDVEIAPRPLPGGGRLDIGRVTARRGAISTGVERRSRDAARTATARNPQARFALSSRATIGSLVQAPRRVDLGPLSPATTLPPLCMSGRLPEDLLIPGLNTLTVVAVAGPGLRVSDTVGFLLAKASTRPGLGGKVPPPLGLKGLPKGVQLTGAAAIEIPAVRKRVAGELARHHPAVAIKPLSRISARSPLLAERLGIERREEPFKRGVLRLSKKNGAKPE